MFLILNASINDWDSQGTLILEAGIIISILILDPFLFLIFIVNFIFFTNISAAIGKKNFTRKIKEYKATILRG